MNKPAGDPRKREHCLADWLALHELDQATCHSLLDAIRQESAGFSTSAERPSPDYDLLDVEVAWLRAVEAMRLFFASQKDIIDDTFERTTKIRVQQGAKSRKAITLDNGPLTYPTIYFSYGGEPRDVLIIAHEFSHALQIRASQGKFVPPIMREVCAFIGESALLSHAMGRDPGRYPILADAWRTDTKRYFGTQRDRLDIALSTPAAPYRYAWNYPIARYLAIQIVEHYSRDRIWSVFQGEISVQNALQELASPHL